MSIPNESLSSQFVLRRSGAACDSMSATVSIVLFFFDLKGTKTFGGRYKCNASELATTLREERAMAKAATVGGKRVWKKG